MLNLVEITPAATDTGVINDVNSFANAGAATFSIDVTLYLWFGNRSLIYNPDNPGSAGSLILIAEDARASRPLALPLTTAVTKFTWQAAPGHGVSISLPVVDSKARCLSSGWWNQLNL